MTGPSVEPAGRAPPPKLLGLRVEGGGFPKESQDVLIIDRKADKPTS